jgi:hypothetical protein
VIVQIGLHSPRARVQELLRQPRARGDEDNGRHQHGKSRRGYLHQVRTIVVLRARYSPSRRNVSDSLSKGTDFLYTQFFSAVARSTALSPAEITEIARTTKLSESEVSAHHLTFQGTCRSCLI